MENKDIKEVTKIEDDTNIRSSNFSFKKYFIKYTGKLIVGFLLIFAIIVNIVLLASNKTNKMVSFLFSFFVLFIGFSGLCGYVIGELVKRNINSKLFSFLTDYLPFIGMVVSMVFIFMGHLYSFAKVNGDSMDPTLRNGQTVVIEKYDIKPNNFDIVVVQVLYRDTNKKENLIKRCWALPGDTLLLKKVDTNIFEVSVKGKNGILYEKVVDLKPTMTDVQIDNLTLKSGNYRFTDKGTDLMITLKKDEYFMIGDNHTKSRDSRTHGFFRLKDICGRRVK